MERNQACVLWVCIVYAIGSQEYYSLKKWEAWIAMSLSKTFSVMVVAAILIGVGGLFSISISDKAHAHGAETTVSLDTHQRGDVDQSNPPPMHEHPKNQDHHQGNCCHSFACAGGAVCIVNDASLLNAAGGRIPLLPVTFVQGQPIPPSEHPPKLNA